MSERTILVIVGGVGAGADVYVDDVTPPGGHRGPTDAQGMVPFQVTTLPNSFIRINAPGFKTYEASLVLKPVNLQIRVGVPADPARHDDVILPPLTKDAPPLPHLEVRGNDFVDAHGQRMVLNGTDQFCAFRQYRDAGPDALRPFIDESHALGFDLWRVFLQGSQAQNQVLELRPTEPGYYDDVRPFVDHLNAHGIIPLLTIGVDNQDVRSPISHWGKIDQLTAGSARILSYFNEWSKNISDFKPEDIQASSGLWSRGSDQSDGVPRRPPGPVLEFHPVRGYQTAMRDAVASPIELFEVQGYHGPLIIDEPGRMGTNPHDSRFLDPVEVQRYSRLLSTLCAGAVMHNWFGQRGQLMDGPTFACASAWTKGMRL